MLPDWLVVERFFLACLGVLPLLSLALWVYASATPYSYPELEALALEVYSVPAQRGEDGSALLRAQACIGLALALSALGLHLTDGRAGALLSGVLASLVLVQPSAAAWILQGDAAAAIPSAVLLSLFCVALVFVARRFAVCAGPLAALALMAGTWLAVATAAEVALRSTPQLYVLHRAVRQPDSPVAQLALGMQLLSIADKEAAAPVLRRAGQLILADSDGAPTPTVYAVAQRLAEFALEPENPDPVPPGPAAQDAAPRDSTPHKHRAVSPENLNSAITEPPKQ